MAKVRTLQQHNHMTRDIKPYGECPKCDDHYCDRCHQRPHSWFSDAGYLCNSCQDEWTAWRRFVVDNALVKLGVR